MPRLLTDRQAEALARLGRGMTQRQAAVALGVRPDAVRTYLTAARVRLGPGPVAELCARAPGDLAAAEERAKRRAETPQDENTVTT